MVLLEVELLMSSVDVLEACEVSPTTWEATIVEATAEAAARGEHDTEAAVEVVE